MTAPETMPARDLRPGDRFRLASDAATYTVQRTVVTRSGRVHVWTDLSRNTPLFGLDPDRRIEVLPPVPAATDATEALTAAATALTQAVTDAFWNADTQHEHDADYQLLSAALSSVRAAQSALAARTILTSTL